MSEDVRPSPDQRAAAEHLFEMLPGLVDSTGDETLDRLPCVQVTLHTGASFDIYKARLVREAMPVWSVRGFYTPAPDTELALDASERRALVLGTQDGRALVSAPPAGVDSAFPSEVVVGSEKSSRSLGDLAAVIASAVRAMFEPGD